MSADHSSPILVTGATGFIGSHIVKTLLERGYTVRGTVRSLSKHDNYQFLFDLTDNKNKLELVEADLLEEISWERAVRGCKYIIHAAGPSLTYEPKDADVLMKPLVEGTMNVLNAGLKHGIKKSVITSTIGTMWLGNDQKAVNEDDWLDESKGDNFHKSQALKEKAIWSFWDQNKDKMEITIINPGFVVGPVLNKTKGASVQMILKLLTGKIPALPNFSMALADVQDVAEAHVNALFSNNTNGKRYLVAGQTLWFEKIASILRGEFGQYGYQITNRKIATQYFKYVAWFDSGAKKTMPYLDKDMKFSNVTSIRELGLKYRPMDQSLIDMGYSFINHQMMSNKLKTQRVPL